MNAPLPDHILKALQTVTLDDKYAPAEAALNARRSLVRLSPVGERPHTNPRALALLGVHHLGVGFHARTLHFGTRFTGFVCVCESTHLHNEPGFIGGGSRSRAYGLTGDPFASDPTCVYVPAGSIGAAADR